MIDHETALSSVFVVPSKRARHIDFLQNAKRRPEFLASLNHFRDLDSRFLIEIAPSDQRPDRIERLLVYRGAPSHCHVISSARDLDGRNLPLGTALEQIVGIGAGTLLSCVPGKLAYFEGEGPSDRFILQKVAA